MSQQTPRGSLRGISSGGGPTQSLSFPRHDVAASALASSSALSEPTERDRAIEELSFDVFRRGNQHLKNVETLTSLPEGLHSFPEVCFIGKPSCGKSSLISCLLHNRKLAKTGRVRGTTRLLQFFNVGDALLLVDTPGYGGWKGRKLDLRPKERANAFAILFRYLALRKGGNLKQVYWCMEASATTPMALRPRDEEIYAFLQREQIPFTVVLTKIDRHWHYYHDQTRDADVIGKDGTPSIAPWRQGSQRQHEDGDIAGENPLGGPFRDVPTPAAGVRRNLAEICDFLGSADVPIIGVSANRWHPERCMNLEALQHDIVDHCTRELTRTEDLTYAKMHDLSYAPPRAEDIERVQLTYPIESFVVPQDDALSLQEMVNRHENAKAHLIAQSVRVDLLSAKDLREGFLQDSRSLQVTVDAEDTQRERQAELPPSLSLAEHTGETQPFLHAARIAGATAQAAELSRTVLGPKKSFSSRASLAAPRKNDIDKGSWWLEASAEETTTQVRETSKELTTSAQERRAGGGAISSVTPFAAAAPQPTPPVPIPFSLDRDAQTVTTINGVRIPRTLVPTTVEDLAIEKEDEMSSFAAKSGAGAYEELLTYDHLHPDAPEAQPFTEVSEAARLPEAELDALPRAWTKSASRRQMERVLRKYVDRERKERSLYVQAEGYMNPWVGQSSGGSGQRMGTVMGLSGDTRGPTGRSGALMRGLKQSGFGGKSYSARTMRGKGRATKKTGSWAA